MSALRARYQGCFKPIPDEEGTETPQRRSKTTVCSSRFKPIPDEEGTETNDAYAGPGARLRASNRSPMRRGLKHASATSAWRALLDHGFKPIPDEEGTET